MVVDNPKIKGFLSDVVEKAKLRIDIDTAQNPELRRAIHVVEVFLHKTGRMCYGGQAINAQLPQHEQFYDAQRSLPDYDFFTPDAENDTVALIEALRDAGFNEISKRIGIHDGTIKIYVNYTAIADITQMIPDFYDTIYAKSVTVDGIRYVDPLFLRMLMYLEISRPRGQVERWDKVYERLTLLDRRYPIKICKKLWTDTNKVAKEARQVISRYIFDKQRPYMGIDLHTMYKSPGSTRTRSKFFLEGSAPVIFLSPNATEDAAKLSELTMTTTKELLGFQNMIPAMIVLYKGDKVAGIVVQEEACHAVTSITLSNHRVIRIASLDTMITFLIGLYYRIDFSLMPRDHLLCLIKQYIDLSNRYRAKPTKLFPAFPIECNGYQTTFASLLRAKAARIQAERQRVSSGRFSMTRKRKPVNRTSMTYKRY